MGEGRASGPAVPGGLPKKPNYGNSSDSSRKPAMGQTRRQPKSGIPKSPCKSSSRPWPGSSAPSSSAPAGGANWWQLIQAKEQVQQALEERRQATREIASASQAWVEQQTQLRRDIETLLAEVEPQPQ